MSAKATVKVAYRNEVSYEWERAQHLRDYREGRMSRDELCDADFLLRAAAEHHGVDMHKSCPLCEHDLRLTRWVYGDCLGRRAGSARSEQEIADLVAEGLEFTVHAVEVCPVCRWNHLLRAATVYALG